MPRKTHIYAALVVGLGLSVSAHAGDNNNGSINQSGTSNSATVDQTAASYSNQSVSNYLFNPTDNYSVDQQGSYNTAVYQQIGNLNNGQIQQINDNQGGYASLYQNGSGLQGYIAQGNTSGSWGYVGQNGSSNYAYVVETNSTGVAGFVYQGYSGVGTGNVALVTMDSKVGEASNTWLFNDNFHASYGYISGIWQDNDVGDYATINQFGAFGVNYNTSALILQSNGGSNQAAAYQSGETNGFLTIEQHGTDNVAYAQQYAGTAEAHILQYGSGEQANTYQTGGAPGEQNYAEIDQGVLAASANNIASITQSGFANTALITQNGYGNNATITQAGVGNNATIHQ